MSKFTGIIVGGLEIAAGAALLATGVGAPFGAMLIAAGSGTLIAGLGTLLQKGPLAGTILALKNPIANWEICYGRCCVGGTTVDQDAWGDSNKYLDLVIVLAGNSCRGVSALRFDGKRVQIDTSAVPPGVPPSTFPFINGGTSFTPVQQTVAILGAGRVNNVSTLTLAANIPLLDVGDEVDVRRITDLFGVDNTGMNGTWIVSNIVSQVAHDSPAGPGSITFQFINGGPDLPALLLGLSHATVKTKWVDYGRKVYMEVLTGKQTLGETFIGLIDGTPNDGDAEDLLQSPNKSWTPNCSLQGKTAVHLRLHYNDVYFSNGLPAISFQLYGKDDILDPRTSPPAYAYTENSALILADFLNQGYVDTSISPPIIGVPQWGYGAAYGTEIPIPQLITAANICDERIQLQISIQVFAPNLDSEPRYATNGHFPLSMRRGEILQNLLTACAGRITYTNGQFIIWPAAWYGGGLTVLPEARPFNALMGAFTEGVIPETQIVSSMFIGNGPAYFTAPPGSNYLQLGMNGNGLSAGQIEVAVRINGGDAIIVTVTGKAICWNFPNNSNAPFQVQVNAGRDIESGFGFDQPVYIPCNEGDYLQVQYLSGFTVVLDFANPDAPPSGEFFVDGNGYSGLMSGGVTGPHTLVPSHWTTTFYNGTSFELPSPLPVLADPFTWVSKRKFRDLYNGVKGKYISPANNWQPADFPPFCQDVLHGYTWSTPHFENDANLEADMGVRLWKDIQLPFTISYAAAQRLAKIELMRIRMQGTGTFQFNMWGYQLTPMDVIEMTLPFLGFDGKLLEVTKHRFLINEAEDDGGNKVVSLATEVEVQETAIEMYAWDGFTEQLYPSGTQQAVMPFTSPTPDFEFTSLKMESGPKNAVIGADGVSRAAILLGWPKPTDGFMQNGGLVQGRYLKVLELAQALVVEPPTSPPSYYVPPATDPTLLWIMLPDFNPFVETHKFDVQTDSESYYRVQLRTVNCAGVPSNWVDCINSEIPHDPPYYTLIPHQTASRISPADNMDVNGEG